MKKYIRKRLREEINASEAYSVLGSIKTILHGKRNIAFISGVPQEILDAIDAYGLKKIHITKNQNQSYIVYNPSAEAEAKELLNIANKYGGYLSYQAPDNEQRRIGQLLGYKPEDIESYIQRNNPKKVREETIDGQNMNQGTQTVCNTMSVATYDEGIKLITAAIGSPEQNPKMWQRISKPLNNWKQENTSIGNEVKTMGMSGDSMVDESNTWWTAIQSTICEQGGDFQ